MKKEIDIKEIKTFLLKRYVHASGKNDLAMKTKTIEYFKKNNVNNYMDETAKWTPLMFISFAGNIDKYKLLKNVGNLEIDKKNDKGIQAVHIAVMANNIRILRKLIIDGVDLDSKTNEGITPLILAIQNRNKLAIKMLLKHGANVEVGNELTPYEHAIKTKDPEVIQEIEVLILKNEVSNIKIKEKKVSIKI